MTVGKVQNAREGLKKKVDFYLYLGLVIFLIVFLATGVYVALISGGSNSGVKEFRYNEVVWFSMNTLTVTLLTIAGVYTVKKMSKLFGEFFKKEASYVSAITITFCVCQLIRSVYDWVIFYNAKPSRNTNINLYAYWFSNICLGVIWDTIPILMIYMLHQHNFKEQNEDKIEGINESSKFT